MPCRMRMIRGCRLPDRAMPLEASKTVDLAESGLERLPRRAHDAVGALCADHDVLPASRGGGGLGQRSPVVSVVVVDDARIRSLNREWRGKDKATDVLSWPMWEIDDPLGDELGDVVISVDTARRQAAARDWDVDDELALLLVHGILHLLGHEDDTEAGSEAMRVIEARILGKPLDPLEGTS